MHQYRDQTWFSICWAPREVLKPEPERRGFQHPRGIQQMLIYQKSMFDRQYCIDTFCCSKTLGNLLRRVLFFCTYNGAKKHIACERFENAASRAQTRLHSLLWALLVITAGFVTAPGCKPVRRQHVNGLVDAWICAGWNVAVNSVRHSFLSSYILKAKSNFTAYIYTKKLLAIFLLKSWEFL